MISITASDLVAKIKMGWNLGNTFDAHGEKNGFAELRKGYIDSTPTEMEAAWVDHVTTRENIDAIKAAGFNAIRIPVTWLKACDADYNIRADWIARVKEVVGYAAANNMIISVDSHHDERYYSLLDKDMPVVKKVYVKLWEQIAEAFKDYDENLILEGLNEPRTIGTKTEWYGTTEDQKNLNMLNQLFVDTVRSSGGNNSHRILMVPTVAASASEVAQRAFVLPNDTVKNRLIVSLHSYEPFEFALETGHDRPVVWDENNPDDTEPITAPIDLAYELFVSKAVPVIMGEMGALNRNNIDSRVAWTEFYVSYARSKKIPCFWWDPWMTYVTRPDDEHDHWVETFGIFNRETNEFDHPGIVLAMQCATSGTSCASGT